jgi:hypothetical protein
MRQDGCFDSCLTSMPRAMGCLQRYKVRPPALAGPIFALNYSNAQ